MRILLLATIALTIPAGLQAQRGRGGPLPRSNDGPYGALSYRFIGPPGNRVISVAGIPGNSATYYAGAASGGIWKTLDGGTTWRPIFDSQRVASIGSLVVAAFDSNTAWAGTGETFIRSHRSLGWGIFKSTDAGATWAKMGLDSTGRDAIRAIEDEIARYDADGKVRAVEREIAAFNVDARVAVVEKRIRDFDVEREVSRVEREIANLGVERRVRGIEGDIRDLEVESRIGRINTRRDEALDRLRAVLRAR